MSVSPGAGGHGDHHTWHPPTPPKEPARYGWDERGLFTILISVFCVHAVLYLNYAHLRRTQNIPQGSRAPATLRTIVFIFMPTLVIAELVLSFWRTMKLFLFADSDKLTVEKLYDDTRRYICGLAGMHVAQARPFHGDEDNERRGEDQNEALLNASTINTSTRPPLALVQESDDLQRQRLKWNLAALLRIVLMILAMALAIGTIVLAAKRDWHCWSGRCHTLIGLDRRNMMAAISSVVCSITGIILVCCRSEYSLKPMSGWTPSPKPFLLSTFIWEIIIGSFFYEMPFIWMEELEPLSWARWVGDLFDHGAGFPILCTGLLIWFLCWMFAEQIRRTPLVKVNWHFVFAIPIISLLIWILVDNISLIVVDVLAFFEYNSRHGAWDRDPISKFIPFC